MKMKRLKPNMKRSTMSNSVRSLSVRYVIIAMDGMSYEYSVIREWFREHSTSPVTNLQLRSKLLIRNTALRNAMQEWNELATLPGMPRGEAGAVRPRATGNLGG